MKQHNSVPREEGKPPRPKKRKARDYFLLSFSFVLAVAVEDGRAEHTHARSQRLQSSLWYCGFDARTS